MYKYAIRITEDNCPTLQSQRAFGKVKTIARSLGPLQAEDSRNPRRCRWNTPAPAVAVEPVAEGNTANDELKATLKTHRSGAAP
jgi:hypothetical protein